MSFFVCCRVPIEKHLIYHEIHQKAKNVKIKISFMAIDEQTKGKTPKQMLFFKFNLRNDRHAVHNYLFSTFL